MTEQYPYAMTDSDLKLEKSLLQEDFEVLHIGDLHLHTSDLSSMNKGAMRKSTRITLADIKDTIEQRPSIKMVIFMGDIQHKTPNGLNTLKETTIWKKWFGEIGEIMRERYDPKDFIIRGREGEEQLGKEIQENKRYPIFTIKGNHDIDTKRNMYVEQGEAEQEQNVFTFYDVLIDEGYIVNPKQVIVKKKLLYNFHNYGEGKEKYPRIKGIQHRIALMHENIMTEETEFWLEKVADTIPSSEALNRVDEVINGHIHTSYEPLITNREEGGVGTVWIFGSVGRTSASTGHMRDYGCGAIKNLKDIHQHYPVQFKALPMMDYFNFTKLRVREEKKNRFKDFKLTQDEMQEEEKPFEPVDLLAMIRNREEMDENVREKCIELLESVDNVEMD